MNTFKSLTALALAALLALPAAAQENTETGATPGFDMGTPVDENGQPIAQEPQVGQQYIKEEHGDWLIRCLRTENPDEDPCQLYQLLSNEDGVDVAEISLIKLPEGGQAAAGATIVAPLGTLLTEQITLRVDGGTARRFAFTTCTEGGCISRIGFTAQDVALFKGGANATIRLVPAADPSQEFVLTISLTGFTAGYDAL